MVGLLLVGLFCIQCIPTNEANRGNTALAKIQLDDPDRAALALEELAKTDHIALLKLCQENYAQRYRDYTCKLIKQERIKGALGQEQHVRVKFLQQPFSVAMNWEKNAPIADRMLYVEGKHNGQMIVRPKSGLLQLLTGGAVFRKPDGADAMKNTLRPVSLFGFHRGTRALLDVYEAAEKAGHLREEFGGYAEVGGRKAIVLERYLPAKSEAYPAWKTVVCIDMEYLVPIKIVGYDWDERLTSSYTYEEIRFNEGLTNDDFLPEANGLKLPGS